MKLWKTSVPFRSFSQLFPKKHPEVYSICEAASLVALGGFDGNIVTSQYPHDVAALKIIVEEAGGKVTDLSGNAQRYDRPINGAIVSNGLLHGQLLEIVRTTGISSES